MPRLRAGWVIILVILFTSYISKPKDGTERRGETHAIDTSPSNGLLKRGCAAWVLLLGGFPSFKNNCTMIQTASQTGQILGPTSLGVNLADVPEQLVLQLLKPIIARCKECTFVDIGTNLGQLSVQVLKEFRSVRGYLFEPNPQVCMKLLATLVNAAVVDRSIVVCTAISEKTMPVSFLLDERSTSSRIVRGSNRSEGTITTLPIDEVVPPGLPLAMFKSDTQGHELQVVRGARSTLQNRKAQAVIIETSFGLLKSQGSSVTNLLKEVHDLGYVCTTLGFRGVVDQDATGRLIYGELPAPNLPLLYAPEVLERVLANIGRHNHKGGWTDILCAPY